MSALSGSDLDLSAAALSHTSGVRVHRCDRSAGGASWTRRLQSLRVGLLLSVGLCRSGEPAGSTRKHDAGRENNGGQQTTQTRVVQRRQTGRVIERTGAICRRQKQEKTREDGSVAHGHQEGRQLFMSFSSRVPGTKATEQDCAPAQEEHSAQCCPWPLCAFHAALRIARRLLATGAAQPHVHKTGAACEFADAPATKYARAGSHTLAAGE